MIYEYDEYDTDTLNEIRGINFKNERAAWVSVNCGTLLEPIGDFKQRLKDARAYNLMPMERRMFYDNVPTYTRYCEPGWYASSVLDLPIEGDPSALGRVRGCDPWFSVEMDVTGDTWVVYYGQDVADNGDARFVIDDIGGEVYVGDWVHGERGLANLVMSRIIDDHASRHWRYLPEYLGKIDERKVLAACGM